MSKLADVAIRKAKPETKSYKMADGGGMFLFVHTNGGKYWRMDYSFEAKRKTLALGVYPDVSLADARNRRDDARKLLANGVDPSEVKKAQATSIVANTENSFEVIAREWFNRHAPNWKENHSSKIIARLEKDIFPWIGSKAITSINAQDLLTTVRRIEARGALETAHRALACCGQVYRYAVATQRAERDPTGDLRGALPPVKNKNHFAAITEPKMVGELMRDIDGYQGSYIVKGAFKLSPYLARTSQDFLGPPASQLGSGPGSLAPRRRPGCCVLPAPRRDWAPITATKGVLGITYIRQDL